MKFGCCLNMVATRPDGIGSERLEQLAAYGYDYAELPLAEIMSLSQSKFSALLAQLQQAGVPCEACNNFFPPALRLTGPQTDSREIRDYADRVLDRAAALGARVVVFGSGGAKNVPEGFPLEKGYGQVAELLGWLGPAAQARGITIAIEPLRQAECNLINRYAEGCKLAREVGHSHVKVLVDYYHLREEREPVEHLLDDRGMLCHVHFARSGLRSFPAVPEEDCYHPFFLALKELGYDSRISLEAYTKRFEEDAPKALALLRDAF